MQFDAVDRERRVSDLISRNKKTNLVTYPKYILTEETVQHLRTPTFDIWQWEPNEVCIAVIVVTLIKLTFEFYCWYLNCKYIHMYVHTYIILCKYAHA